MAQTADLSFLDTPLFRTYFLYASILVVKMMVMSPLTGLTRFRYKVSPVFTKMAQTADLSFLDTPLFRTYFLYASILVVKIMIMSPLTAVARFRYKAFANPEDAAGVKVKPRVDENVERVRRAHLNDIENISLFFVIGFIYCLTNPAVGWATLLFRVYTAARFIHTFVYAIFVIPQPARAFSWGVGFLITGYMALQSIMHFIL